MLIRRFRNQHAVLLAIVVIGTICMVLFMSPQPLRQETEYPLDEWVRTPTIDCHGHFRAYGHEFAWLQYSHILSNTTFSVPCDSKVPAYNFRYSIEGPLQMWMGNLMPYPTTYITDQDSNYVTAPTFVIKRIEAHNLYHTLCEWMNVFLVSKVMKLNASLVDIVWMDDRPPSPLDDTWTVLFDNVYIYKTDENLVYKNLIWNIIGYNSPINFHNLPAAPYFEDFRDFFLKAYGVSDEKRLDCNKLKITVILRKDYMTHPERKDLFNGLVHRKFKNEDEIVDNVKSVFTQATVETVILEQMSMFDQLKVMTQTDVLIGMHGAGMSHVMFLPAHAVVFEIFPQYWGFLRHFKAFARWRGVKYFGSKNEDLKNEFDGFYTYIPSSVVREHCQKILKWRCMW
ncbi:uncharacterized protein LOC127851401 [Dreissena polymorpha]|uniref:EGF domain-specific O-linked N-acetylglucosamine transferase n=1 Tax=Dreissena polymorpha TaxID=45954 RepID=A0A9D4D060_DREPO|nr:uncharacterized protein LOC127851401 [Dreissena polymorpha]KAH3736711.1 hypothetical protein DPMN_043284 [Dreissena polymorpha]